ncbi:MAG: DPP IV N-terminal domain-containing protein [Gracilimonas sp.]|uniref:S9 family peptidase n=1 Tax=Gracilimonas sp. TaxID=1974203 RepID=UPI0019CD079C|nr:S9 family peptidase [Gracilimonas sp.]MBD3615235.1 DPP IV N-terminal domain-containing protein [Gracilimonas sp.]
MKVLKLSVLLLVICSVTSVAQDKQPIEFTHLFDGTFSPNNVQNVRWMNDGGYYSATNENKIIRFNIVDGTERTLFDGADFEGSDGERPFNIQGYQFSADESKLLIKTDIERIWRRSTRENYYVYDIGADELSKLTQSEEKQQYAELSPQGDRAAFVRDNNLFWVDLETGVETQITDDGEFNKIINGAADWVYEEEFGFAKAWFWSPDGNRIGFYKFNEERVQEFFMTEWDGLYPEAVKFKYPKAGEDNSIVSIHVYHLDSGETVTMDIGDETDQYIPRINWTNDNNLLAIRRMNRLQNKLDLLFANAETGSSEVILTEESDTWIDIHDNLHFLSNGKQFITTSDKDGYNHVYLYNMEGEELQQVTNGEWDVTSLLGHDERNYRLYYVGTEESSLERHLYSVRVDGKRKEKLTEGAGWHSINMSRDFKYYIDNWADYNKPPVVSLHRQDGREVRTIEANTELAGKMEEYSLIQKEFLTLDINGAQLNAYMMKPVDFDSTRQYPLLMYVYGGPGSQTVTRRFESGVRPMWHQYLANQGYIVVSVDNRGTGGRGRDFKKQTYKKLGQLETADQIEAAKYFSQLSFVDANRIGIWGWSYGGYMSSLALAEGADVFSTAIAVAPVTHWKYYDTIYTERFMQTPQLNPEGYKEGSPLTKAEQIEGNYLLVHGTGDDNVHYQNAVEMVDALIAGDVHFDLMIYPNRNHGIYGGNTSRHLYRMMNEFILENL